MLRTLITTVIIFSVADISFSQLESLSPLDYEIIYKTEDSYLFKIDLYNPTENDIQFKWTLDYNFELTPGFSYFNTDLDQEYVPGILSICSRPLINTLPPKDTLPIYVGFRTIDILPDVLANGPELNYYLQSPDCDSTYLHYTFKIIDRSVAVIDQSDSDFIIYPNPASDMVFMDFPNSKKGRVVICNSIGQVVIDKNTEATDEAFAIRVSSLPSGLYNFTFTPKADSSQKHYHTQFVKIN
jgi:hypothetical protein